MSFRRDVATTILSRVAILVLGVVQSVIVARYLMPEGRGRFAVLMLVPQFVVMIAPLGVHWALTYHLRRQEHSRERVLHNGTAITLVLGGAGLLVVAFVEYFLRDSFLAGLGTVALVLAALVVPVRIAQSSIIAVFRGTERISWANVLFTLRPVVTILGVLVALVWLAGGVTGVASAVVVAELVVVLVGLVFLTRSASLGLRFDRPVVASMLSYGTRIYAFSILMFVNYRLDLGIVRHFLNYEEVGYYVTSVTLAEYLWMVPNALSFVLFPAVVGVADEQRDRRTSSASRITTVLMLIGCIGFGVVAYPLIRLLYGDAFLPAYLPLVALLPGIWMMSIQQVLGADLSARGRPEQVTISAGVGVLVNVLLNLWWVPRIGIVGAALASTVSYGVVAVMVLAFYRRVSGRGLVRTLVIDRDDIQGLVSRLGVRWGRS